MDYLRRDHRARIKKMAAFCSRMDLAIEVNRHFLKNKYSDVPCFVWDFSHTKSENAIFYLFIYLFVYESEVFVS